MALWDFVWVKGKKGTVIPVQATKRINTARGIISKSRASRFTTGQELQHPSNKMTVGPQSQFGRYVEENNLLSLPGF